MKLYYHATPKKNLKSILEKGLKPSIEGGVYVCDKKICAAYMAMMHGNNDSVIIPIIYDDSIMEVTQTFDHDPKIFPFDCFMISMKDTKSKHIPVKSLDIDSIQSGELYIRYLES